MIIIAYDAQCIIDVFIENKVIFSDYKLPTSIQGEVKKRIKLETPHNGIQYLEIVYPEKLIFYSITLETFMNKFKITKTDIDKCIYQ